MALFKCMLTLLTIGSLHANIQPPTFMWDPRNRMFSKDNRVCKDASISVNYGTSIYFTCPHEAINSGDRDETSKAKSQFENMYLVKESEYKNCIVEDPNQKPILLCDKPYDSTAIQFVNFYIFDTKSSKRINFKKDTTYYLIATSTGEHADLEKKKDGRCKNGMKLKMHVTENAKTNPHMCSKPLPETTTTTSPPSVTEEPAVTETPSNTEPVETTKKPTMGSFVEIDNNKGEVAKQTGDRRPVNDDAGSEFNYLTIVMALVGFFVGIAVTVAFVAMRRRYYKRENQSPSVSSSEETSVFDLEEGHNTIPRTDFNKTYFDQKDNPGYRESRAFHRLESESHEKEKHSAQPIGQYK